MFKQVSIVLAKYCPHCVPFSLSNARKVAEDFGVPLRILDVEIPEEEAAADRLVEDYGDWSVDYLIPQVFLEYSDGRVDHWLTGFSESVSVTEAAWEALFSSRYYQNLIHERGVQEQKPLKRFVEKHLRFQGRCRRHCTEPTTFTEILSDPDKLVGAYVCPGGYVSRVIYFSVNPDIVWFEDFLVSQVGDEMVNIRDIRPATRHGWELGHEALLEIGDVNPECTINEVYWTIYPKTQKERNRGVFLCFDQDEKRGCQNLFVQDIKLKNKLCENCETDARHM